MADYISMYSGSQMDEADTLSLNPDAVPTEGSGNLVTSDGVARAIGSAQNASAPAILNTASGAVASFSDGSASPMTSVVAEIVASQAGSGTPYPAGGGKNKINMADSTAGITAFGLLSAVSGEYITLSGTCNSGGSHTWEFVELSVAQQPLAETLSFKGFIISGAAGTAIGSISYNSGNGKLIINMTGLVTNQSYNIMIGIVGYAGDAPASWSPYSNIRPISGYTGANVYNPAYAVEMGGINDSTGADVANTIRTRTGFIPISCLAFNMIDVYGKQAGELIRSAHYYAADNSYISYQGINLALPYTTALTVPNNAAFVRLVFRLPNDATETADGKMAILSNAASVSWADTAGTVYGGTVDLVSGVLTVTHKAVDLGTLAWAQATSGSVVYFRAGQADKAYGLDNILCSCYQQGTAYVSSTPDCSIAGRASSREVIVKDSTKAAMTAEEFAAAVSGQTLVYELTTAETYTLSGQEIASLLGDNTLWNDVGGDTSAEYRADTKKYIQSLLGA